MGKFYKYLPSKYLPSKYLESTISKGDILFRNLTYFRQQECQQRGDMFEGSHRDNPDNDIEIKVPSTGKRIVGDMSFINSTDTDLIYAFCVSMEFNEKYFDDFKSDTCIEIFDDEEFIRRIRMKLNRLISVHKNGLLHSPVKYYEQGKRTGFDIKDPKQIIFCKDFEFSGQSEYRIAFGTKKAFKLEQSIVLNKTHDFRAEAMKGTAKEKTISIGSIEDIVTVIKCAT